MGGDQAIEGCYIRITDGFIYVDASGDGLDSNGDLYVDGGTVLVCGPTSGADGALDYNGAGVITGGTVVAVGSAGMAQGFSDSSTQSSMLVYFDETQAAGTTLSLADENGNTIFSFTPGKEYQTAVISTPELNDGQTYDIYSGTNTEGEENEGYISGGTFSGGEKLISVTIDGVVTSNRSTAAGNMGGSGQGRNGAWGKDKAKQKTTGEITEDTVQETTGGKESDETGEGASDGTDDEVSVGTNDEAADGTDGSVSDKTGGRISDKAAEDTTENMTEEVMEKTSGGIVV